VEQPVQGLAEQVQSVVGQLGADGFEVDADLLQAAELGARLVDFLQDRLDRKSVV